MLGIIMSCLFFGLPAGAVAFFAVSLWKFLSLRKRQRRASDNVDPQLLKKWKMLLIVASCIAGILVAVVLSFVILLFLAVAYM